MFVNKIPCVLIFMKMEYIKVIRFKVIIMESKTNSMFINWFILLKIFYFLFSKQKNLIYYLCTMSDSIQHNHCFKHWSDQNGLKFVLINLMTFWIVFFDGHNNIQKQINRRIYRIEQIHIRILLIQFSQLITTSQYHNITTSQYHYITISLHHYITMYGNHSS